MLSDVKDNFKQEKEGLNKEIERLTQDLLLSVKEKETLLEKIAVMDKQIQGTKDEHLSIVKEKTVLLTRVIFLGEQRSDLMLRVDELTKRVAEQAATIAGLNDEWGSLQGELSSAERDKGRLESTLLAAVRGKEDEVSYCPDDVLPTKLSV